MPPGYLWELGQSSPKVVVLPLRLCRKDGKKDQDSRSAPEPKKPEENPASVSVGCLLMSALELYVRGSQGVVRSQALLFVQDSKCTCYRFLPFVPLIPSQR